MIEHLKSKNDEEARRFAETLRDIDERHGRTTQRGIEEYETAFDTRRDELLKGQVLNIGDPLARLPADFPNVVSLDYFYGTDMKTRVEEFEKPGKDGNLTEQQEKSLELYRNWVRQTASRLEGGAKAVKGIFPSLPFKDRSFDRVISLNAISMHPFDELGGFTKREWEIWWGELLRVLKPGGKAYIGPFDRLSEHETWVMKQNLKEKQEQGLLNFRVAEREEERGAPWIGPDYVIIEKPEVIRMKTQIGEFLELLKTVDLIPPGFQADRLKELPTILERAREHAKRLRFAKVVPCDVCVENFVQDKDKRLELGGRIFGEAGYFSSEDMTPEFLEELYPEWNAEPSVEDGRVRVHGITQDGKYQTYCHFCDDDMCLSQVEDGPDWDKVYESQYRDFLSQLPDLLGIRLLPASEWEALTDSLLKGEQVSEEIETEVPEVRGFYFSGCTAWLVNAELLVDEGQLNREFVFFVHEGRKWTAGLSPANDPLVRRIGHKPYKPIR